MKSGGNKTQELKMLNVPVYSSASWAYQELGRMLELSFMGRTTSPD